MSSINYNSSVLWMPLFELPIENNKHPNFEWRGGGRGVDFFWFSEDALFGYNASTIFSPIVDFVDSNGSFQTWKIWGVSLLDLALLSPSSMWETDSSKPFFICDLAKSSYNWTWKTKKNSLLSYRIQNAFSNFPAVSFSSRSVFQVYVACHNFCALQLVLYVVCKFSLSDA